MSARAAVVVTLDSSQLLALGEAPSGAVYRTFLNLAARIDTNAKRKLSNDYLHVRTGNLRSSQGFRVENRGGVLHAINENVASYAAALHNGSQPHVIRARRVHYLTGWSYNGSPVFTPVVHHPGTKPKPWLRDAQREELAALR